MAETAAQKLKRMLAEKKAARELAESAEKVDAEPNIGTSISMSNSQFHSDNGEDGDSSKPGQSVCSTEEVASEEVAKEFSSTALVTTQTLLDSDPEGFIAPGSEVSLTHPLVTKIARLAQMLNEQVPGFEYLLKEIHDKTRDDQEIATILSEEEIGVIVRGLSTHKDITIVAAPKSSKKKTQPVTSDMLD